MQTMIEMMGAVAVAGIVILLLLGVSLVGIILVVGSRNKSPEERKLEDNEQAAYLRELAAKAEKK